MATDYTVIASQTITELVPPLGIRDVQELTVQANPSGVTFPLHVQLIDMQSGAWRTVAAQVAQAFNDLANEPGVADVQVQQDVKASGQIVSYIVVTVESDDGMKQQDVRFSWGAEFRGFGTYDKIAAIRQSLNAINDG